MIWNKSVYLHIWASVALYLCCHHSPRASQKWLRWRRFPLLCTEYKDLGFLHSWICRLCKTRSEINKTRQEVKLCQTQADTRTHTHTDTLNFKNCLFFFHIEPRSRSAYLTSHVIHHSDHYQRADHHSCIWDAAFHQYGLLTSAPLEINLCFLINHTCWCNIHHWWGVDKIAFGAVKRCLVDLVTMHRLFHHHRSPEVLYTHAGNIDEKHAQTI